MNLRLISSLFLSIALIAAAPAPQQAPTPIRSGALLIKFRSGVSLAQAHAALPSTTSIETTLGSDSYVLRVPNGAEQRYADQLAALPQILYAQPDHLISAQIQPNDPSFTEQWNLQHIGMPQAWETMTSTASLIVAMLDTGTAITHPDLAGQLWTNPNEIPGNDSDDDGNGLIDDLHGAHFYHVYSGDQAYARQDADVDDPNGHGTHVAGIIAAGGNNGQGISGVAWNTHLMVLRVLEADGYGWESDIIRGLQYAIDAKAQVVNLSLGLPQATPALADLVAQAEAHGVLLVAAAGNNSGAVLYPAAYPTVLSVGASSQIDQRATFSAYGARLDLIAPGVDILSTWNGLPYHTRSGTSMAAPHATGVAALLRAAAPEATPAQIRSCIIRMATDLGPPGRDDTNGAGLLNAARTLSKCPFEVVLPLLAAPG